MCWTNKRFEGGKGTPCEGDNTCMCVKQTENGDPKLRFKQQTDDHGKAMIQATYLKQIPLDCSSCEAYNHNLASCRSCPGCKMQEKEVGGTMMHGCFDTNPLKTDALDKSARENGRLYMAGRAAEPQELVVLPHYSFWDPGDKPSADLASGQTYPGESPDTKWQAPFQSRRESLSRETWLEKYAEAAPRMQRRMDLIVKKVKPFAQNMDTASCQTANLNCLSAIPSRLLKAKSVQQACQKMQATEMQIRTGGPTEFSSETPGKKKVKPINCRMGSGKCERLNCYTTERDFVSGMKCIKERLRSCKGDIQKAQNALEAQEGGLVDDDDMEEIEPDEPDGAPVLKGMQKPGDLGTGGDPGHGGPPDEVDKVLGSKDEKLVEEAAAVDEQKMEEAAARGEDPMTAVDGSHGDPLAQPSAGPETLEGDQMQAQKELQAEEAAHPGIIPGTEDMPGGGLQAPPGALEASNPPVPGAVPGQQPVPASLSLEGPVKLGVALWTAVAASASAVQTAPAVARRRRQAPKHQRHQKDEAYRDFLCALSVVA